MQAAEVLVVEDDEDLRDALSQLLREDGFRVASVDDGLAALKYLRKYPAPCLILLDLVLPTMYGFEFREQQLREPALVGIPVVVMSAISGAFQREDRLHAAAYLQKPFPAEAVLALAAEYCRSSCVAAS